LIKARGAKRFVTLTAVAVAAAVLAAAAATQFVPVDGLRDAVKEEIHAVTGLDPSLRGPVSISMFPAATVRFADVVLGEQEGEEPPLAVDELTANLRLLPLLAGRIEISDIALSRPQIMVALEPGGRTNWSALVDTLARTLNPKAQRDERVISFSEIRISDGTVAIQNADHTWADALDNVELSLAWPSIAKSFAATGHFAWHGQQVDASLAIANFPAALAGADSGLKFRANAGPLKAAFDGNASYVPSLKIDGTLAADAPSLREALLWTGDRALPAGGLGRFALKAHAGVNGGTVALTALNIELDGNTAEGALSYATSGRQMLQGTLAVEKLDLRPYMASFRLMTDNTHEWDKKSFGLDWFKQLDADLRLSAASVGFAHAELGRTAVAANLRTGRLVLSVGESQSFGGTITGTIALAKAETGAEFKSQMQFANVELEKCLGELFGFRRVEGTGNLAISVEGSGANVDEVARSVNGTARLTARRGALSGLNVDQILRRLQRSPLSGNGDFRSGRTPFDNLNIELRVAEGLATVEDIRLEGPNVRVALGGTTSIPFRELDLSGTATLIGAPDTASFELPFVVQGPWESPLLLPDTQTLIRRSEATAPLLDALQDRRTQKAVQSVLDKLIGGVPAATPPPAIGGR
jgi:AsmA protein